MTWRSQRGHQRERRYPLYQRPQELLIAKTAANVIEAAGYLYDGFSMQMMGSGGASLATARFLRQKMLDRHMRCRFALGGITGQIAAMYEEDSLTGFWMCRALTWMRPNL